jgi:pyrimidine operon attenuation protein/uracil phosphoribosyltransferase
LPQAIDHRLPNYPITQLPNSSEGVSVPVVIDADRMGRTLVRIAHEILERSRGVEELALVGIRTRGVPIARRLAQAIKEINGHEVPTGALDITLYRDDLMRHPVGPQPVVRRTEIPFSIDGKRILLVDDVLYTGRTIRAALDALIDFGRPQSIQLVVLVDRGHRELPIKADYVGKNLPTAASESVQVHLMEVDGRDEVEVQPS